LDAIVSFADAAAGCPESLFISMESFPCLTEAFPWFMDELPYSIDSYLSFLEDAPNIINGLIFFMAAALLFIDDLPYLMDDLLSFLEAFPCFTERPPC
jgi:hypothetical protein